MATHTRRATMGDSKVLHHRGWRWQQTGQGVSARPVGPHGTSNTPPLMDDAHAGAAGKTPAPAPPAARSGPSRSPARTRRPWRRTGRMDQAASTRSRGQRHSRGYRAATGFSPAGARRRGSPLRSPNGPAAHPIRTRRLPSGHCRLHCWASSEAVRPTSGNSSRRHSSAALSYCRRHCHVLRRASSRVA